uniref:Gustatory receptor 6 n=1 Tax=Pyrrhalta aenescens TaxID=281545 RepID=A0A1J0KKS9_9CUCU|nr:gustatory receptor 6 [Pyrrhalta aenescens]
MENIKDVTKNWTKRKLPTKRNHLNFHPDFSQTSHDFLKYILLTCQFIGLFPMHNICGKDPAKIKFSWLSWKIVYTIIISASSIFCSYSGYYRAFTFHPVITHLLFPVVFTQVAVATLISINVSKNWQKCITSITYLELEINKKYGEPKNVRKYLMFLIFIIYAIGSIEHLFELISNALQFGSSGFINCIRERCNYFYHECNTCWSAVFLVFCTISWAVCIAIDVFIINLGVLFASRFKQIADSFESYNDALQIEETSHIYRLDNILKYYKQIREDYIKLTSAVYQVDCLCGNLIICSYISNITSILIQLFNSLRHFNSLLHTIHFLYSFGFIIMRLVLVTIYASSVNEESKKIASIVLKVPDDIWSQDLQRIISHIYYDSTALTGGQFFKITRSLTLNVDSCFHY